MNAFAKALHALPEGPYLLAVSGGRDSMALLHAFAEARPGALSAVATFDHGTGEAAAEAVELVVRECMGRGISVVAGRAPDRLGAPRAAESALREARWAFLRAVAEERRATIATAHTRDDQAETVAMRILRDASARGLAAMAWPSAGVVRPFLDIDREEVTRYALRVGIPFVDDPSNADPVYLRNRLRTDLLEAAERVRPGFRAALVTVGRRAAAWRAQLAELVDGLGARRTGDAVVVGAEALASLTPEGLAVVWPEVAGRAGFVLDRRGIERLASWTVRARPGQQIPLSGGVVAERTARTFVVRGAGRESGG
ncbi:MAG: tRNA lysidine(34) synthetase TilS [Gemmatimonadetes bacterium]|nr:tRNA lysidine(34) synthetase TilS [Gemmatimonadota bacterium]